MVEDNNRVLLFKLFFLIACLSTLFLSSSSFVEKETLPKWYALIIGVCSYVFLDILFVKNLTFRIDNISLIIFLFFGYIVLNIYLSPYSNQLDFLKITILLLLYIVLKLMPSGTMQYVNTIIILTVSSQAMYGLFQYSSITLNFSFPITGSFDNPIGFGASLAAVLPICLQSIRNNNISRYLFRICGVLIIIGIILSQSRISILCMIIALIVFLGDKYSCFLRKHWKHILPLLLLFLISTFILLFILKKDSAIGRFLIWESTINLVKDNILFGNGNNSFQAQYMLSQAEYFKLNPHSSYSMLADNIFHPFNEYLLLLFEYGVFGVILLFITVYYIIVNRANASLYQLVSILCIGLLSCFSYPLRYPFVWIILLYNLACISNKVKPIYFYTLKLNLTLRATVLGSILILLFFTAKDVRFEYQWKRLIILVSLGKQEMLSSRYEILYKSWNGNSLFLYNYGYYLNSMKQFDKSLSVLHQCENYYNDYDVQVLLSDNYMCLENWEQAQASYHLAAYMCPNRFIPIYGLFKIYENTNQTEKAKKLAQHILNKQEKIPSDRIKIIKQEMRDKLENTSL